MKSECVFCKAYREHIEVDRMFGNPHNYKVALIAHSKSGGRTTDYNVRGIGFRLNYCPECGAEIVEPETQNNRPTKP